MSLKTFSPAIRKRLWVGLLLVVALVLLLSAMRYVRPESRVDQPTLGLMTTLPLQWSEGGIEAAVAADAAPHPVYTRLAQAYQIVPIDDLDVLEKNRLSLLLLAQPRALGPAELVKLDAWVRRGGRLLVLADPALVWGSLYPLGDKRRPLFTSLLSPLFGHWGIELVLPINEKTPLAVRDIDGLRLRTQTLGEWQMLKGGNSGVCVIEVVPIVADCEIGKGRAFLVADADLLDTVYWEGRGARKLTGGDEFGNMRWVEALLLALRDGRKKTRDFVEQ
ncbi:MAG: Gldg family protein [Sphingorhabdus sp.]